MSASKIEKEQYSTLEQDGLRARRYKTPRAIFALMMREMSTTYGRSPGGYIWAILEPTLALMALSAIFSIIAHKPPLGESFPLFYATGYLPFMLFNDVGNKAATSLNYSKPLLQYPAITFMDVLIARALLHLLTHILIAYIIFFGLAISLDIHLNPNYLMIALSYLMGALLGLGMGTFNCFLMMSFPVWERIWQILTRPLIFISGLFLPYDTMPEVAQNILWWNPLIHVVGFLRLGIYDFYEGSYLSAIYPVTSALLLMTIGMVLLKKNHERLMENM